MIEYKETLETEQGTPYRVFQNFDSIPQESDGITMGLIYYNEVCHIETLLESCRDQIEHYVLIDGRITGFPGLSHMVLSDDGTNERISEHFESYEKVPYVTVIEPIKAWKDQMEKRNLYLMFARAYAWIFLPDADEYVKEASWKQFFKHNPQINAVNNQITYLHVTMHDPITGHTTTCYRFLWNTPGLHYKDTHWKLYRGHQKIKLRQVPHAMIPWFEMVHLTSIRTRKRKYDKSVFRQWRKDHKIDTVLHIPAPEYNPMPFDVKAARKRYKSRKNDKYE